MAKNPPLDMFDNAGNVCSNKGRMRSESGPRSLYLTFVSHSERMKDPEAAMVDIGRDPMWHSIK